MKKKTYIAKWYCLDIKFAWVLQYIVVIGSQVMSLGLVSWVEYKLAGGMKSIHIGPMSLIVSYERHTTLVYVVHDVGDNINHEVDKVFRHKSFSMFASTMGDARTICDLTDRDRWIKYLSTGRERLESTDHRQPATYRDRTGGDGEDISDHLIWT